MIRWMWCLTLGVAVCLAGCDRPPQADGPATARGAQSNQQVYLVNGVVTAVTPSEKSVEIKHEAIPNYMPAMTMPFDVKDTNLLAGLEPGQRVAFRLVVTPSRGWIEEIRKLGPPSSNVVSRSDGFSFVREVEPLNIGELLPEYQFTNELGDPFSTARFKGQALAITFLFTRCPYPNFCPRMANDFEEAQQKLPKMPNAPTNWHLLTVSFDPEFDKPAMLKAYAQGHLYNPARWTFATGDLDGVTAFGQLFGLAFYHDETGSITHNLRTAVIGASGRLQRVFEGNKWSSDELVTELVRAAAK
jgi:protein SCO1/2